ncbi:hypothetical protein [Methylorubrum sp. POS3]|uniref:hypothetical protein n=1 Tax=Methylorubrum sp. POS3 TaxID=2998492 RepID=UPI003727E5DB
MAAAAQFEGAIGQLGAYRDERMAANLIRAALAVTRTDLPPTFTGFGDEPDFKARDEAAFSGLYALPGWAITAATEA